MKKMIPFVVLSFAGIFMKSVWNYYGPDRLLNSLMGLSIITFVCTFTHYVQVKYTPDVFVAYQSM